uniref:hypothetical protein n=1 Tax=Paraglaciecola sp. TaxID=1920173 RepID=UPI0030F3EC95
MFGKKLRFITRLSTILLVNLASLHHVLAEPMQLDKTLYIDRLSHPTPYIPAQCYTNPVADNGAIANPCYACHTASLRPNVLNDFDVQLEYAFPESALHNPWANLFKDHSQQVAKISDQAIMAYVRQDNYFDADGNIKLNQRLNTQADTFDANDNGQWDGYRPDIYFNFDSQGFDHKPDNSFSGWRSYAYYPLPGSFMPTNGATDDVSIRLAEPFRKNRQGQYDQQIYALNFAIVEALIREQDITIAATDETKLGVDLDKDGQLGIATQITYDWAPLKQRFMSYVGQAADELKNGKLHLAAKLFPEGTEFVHSVRYLDIDSNKQVNMAARMKELRYAIKRSWINYYGLEVIVADEIKERHDFPARTKNLRGSAEEGLQVPQGWVYQGFIEDKQGELRPQTYEEHASCTGCHSGSGMLMDTNISFYRKLPTSSFQQGWYHWQQKSMHGIPEPKRASDGEYEYSYYLLNNPTGDEFRANTEVKQRFFDEHGKPKADMFKKLHEDISVLMLPSTERAIALNKAYKVLVEEQSFIQGKAPLLSPLDDVMFKDILIGQETGI